MILHPAKKFFHFCGSFRMAVISVLALAIILTFSTFYESEVSTEAVQQLVYRTWWFNLVLGFIFLNVLVATLRRWPFKKKHTGFLITHVGLLTILVGAMLTRGWGIEGTLMFAEGDTVNSFSTDIEMLKLSSPILAEDIIAEKRFTKRVTRSPWSRTLGQTGLVATVDQYYPNSTVDESYDTSLGSPLAALSFEFKNQFTSVNRWLEASVRGRDRIDFGPVLFLFRQVDDKSALQQLLSEKRRPPTQPDLQLEISNKKLNFFRRIAFDPKKLFPVKLPNIPYTIRITDFFPNAIVEANRLKNASDELINPAVLLEVEGPTGTERHVSFASFPDFDSLHQQTNKEYTFKFKLLAEQNAIAERNVLEFLQGPDSDLYYRIQKKEGDITSGRIEIDQPVTTPWMGGTFKVMRYLPQAARSQQVIEAPFDPKDKNSIPAIRLTITDTSQDLSHTEWLRRGLPASFDVGRNTFQLYYGMKSLPLGFEMSLVDFRVVYYPATRSPMSYESDVRYVDRISNIDRQKTVLMNHVLDFRGYRFFQSSYIDRPGMTSVSIFAVNRDPGKWPVYIGSIILCLGICILFFLSPTKNEQLTKPDNVSPGPRRGV